MVTDTKILKKKTVSDIQKLGCGSVQPCSFLRNPTEEVSEWVKQLHRSWTLEKMLLSLTSVAVLSTFLSGKSGGGNVFFHTVSSESEHKKGFCKMSSYEAALSKISNLLYFQFWESISQFPRILSAAAMRIHISFSIVHFLLYIELPWQRCNEAWHALRRRWY